MSWATILRTEQGGIGSHGRRNYCFPCFAVSIFSMWESKELSHGRIEGHLVGFLYCKWMKSIGFVRLGPVAQVPLSRS